MEQLGLGVQPKSRNCIGGEERLMVLARKGESGVDIPLLYSAGLGPALVRFTGPKTKQTSAIPLNSSQILPLRSDLCKCQQLGD